MLEISNTKGIASGKLEHIMLGTVRGDRVSGYHCDKNLSDTKAEIEGRHYSRSKKLITCNKNQKVFEGLVKKKGSASRILKNENGGKSSFFNYEWSRQDVVDCISRIENHGTIVKRYKALSGTDDIAIDNITGLIVVNNQASTYPLIRL